MMILLSSYNSLIIQISLFTDLEYVQLNNRVENVF